VTTAFAINFRANTDSYYATDRTLIGATHHNFRFWPIGQQTTKAGRPYQLRWTSGPDERCQGGTIWMKRPTAVESSNR